MEVIVVSAVWCPSCLILKKHIKKLTSDYVINIKYLDYDLDEEEVKDLDVGKVLPVIIVGDKRLIGEKSFKEIEDFLKECEVI